MEEEKWLKEYTNKFEENPTETALELLDDLNLVVAQYLKSPESSTTKGLLISAEKMIRAFLELNN